MRKEILIIGMILSVFFAGCAPEPKLRVLWPAPPNEPKIEFIGVYKSQYSFKKEGMAKLVETVAGEGQAALFKSPYGIVADGRGRVYISDIHWSNIRVYDFNTQHVDFYFKRSPLTTPSGMAYDSKGRLYIVDSGARRVVVFGPDKQQLYVLDKEDVKFVRPSYLAVNERLGRLYVSDGGAQRVQVFDLEGRHLFTIGEPGLGEGKFFGPQGMAIDSEDRIYVCDQFNALIQVFDADGNYLYQFGERGDQAYQFEGPKDIAFDSAGNLWVVDGRRPHVMTYTPEGDLLLVTGSEKPTTAALGFATPRSIHIDANDRIYITDMTNQRFSVWQYLSEKYLKDHPITEEETELLRQKIQKDSGKKAAE